MSEPDGRVTLELTSGESGTVLPRGGEIHFTDDPSYTLNADRIEILPGGMVLAVYKRSYELKVYPQHKIDSIHTHTKHLEDEEWW